MRSRILPLRLDRPIRNATLSLLVATAAGSARADCSGPFCGSRVIVSAMSGNTQLLGDEVDAVGPLLTETLGPIRTTRLPDPNDPNGQGNPSDEGAVADFAIDQGALAVSAGTESSAVDFGLGVHAAASSRVVYDEYLAVESATLAAGTPVALRMRLRVAFGADETHDLPPAQIDSNTQDARIDLFLQTTLGSHYIAHRWFASADGTSIVDGVFADPTAPFEIAAASQVGQTVRLILDLRDDANSQATVTGFPSVFPNAATGGTAALVFGVEADPPGVTVRSPTADAPVPGPGNVTPANALAHALPVDVGLPVAVPEPDEPGELWIAACALGALAVERRCPRRRLGRGQSPSPGREEIFPPVPSQALSALAPEKVTWHATCCRWTGPVRKGGAPCDSPGRFSRHPCSQPRWACWPRSCRQPPPAPSPSIRTRSR